MCFRVRISGLPFGYLDTQWAQNIISHDGFVETVQGLPYVLPTNPEIRTLVWVDTTIPLIPGCYLPLFDNRIVWVYFHYEGVFRFCKQCGKIGHATASCRLSPAFHIINNRIQSLEREGFHVLRGPSDLPLYTNTNAIRGLNDRFNNRNSQLNLMSSHIHQDPPFFQAPTNHLYQGPTNDNDNFMEFSNTHNPYSYNSPPAAQKSPTKPQMTHNISHLLGLLSNFMYNTTRYPFRL
ncbi:Pyruvate dehydrogenase phosphatase regulatory subunit mitochondrial [Bienertia sinuspersici]